MASEREGYNIYNILVYKYTYNIYIYIMVEWIEIIGKFNNPIQKLCIQLY